MNSQRGRRAEMPPPREKKEKGGGRGEDKKKVTIERDIDNANEIYLQPVPAKQQNPQKGDGGERGKKREATGGDGRGNEKKMKIEEKIIDKVRGSVAQMKKNNEGSI